MLIFKRRGWAVIREYAFYFARHEPVSDLEPYFDYRLPPEFFTAGYPTSNAVQP